MFAIPEQFSAASKASVEAQLAVFSNLTSKSFESLEKVVDLNLTTFKSSVEESSAAVKQLLTVKDPQEWLALAKAQTQPNTEKALAYGRQLASIASGVQAEFSKAAEAQIAENSRKLLDLIDEVTKNAPAGSENAVALFKSAIGNASAGYEQFNKTAKQAADTIETNLNQAVTQFTQPAAAAAKATTRAAKK
ncbi:TIGR01841 family phasin [Noviherbaspirillum sp. CPCC 100848]|uniref:TIGR01841 family phasin n=1 Tax=Noviherbaspirillum album TaxID=3080276 RepID=A0ABU6JHV4_9BURK|nr:TIGR01841 family phasin [Noviherbaspirillum sp. CPCC 100848]MEC4723066.1 TIGR01841 family phasin [Noviherbaspirillum sp. CPCC 100848]